MLTFSKEYNKEIMLCYSLKNDDDFEGNYVCLNNDLETEKSEFKSILE